MAQQKEPQGVTGDFGNAYRPAGWPFFERPVSFQARASGRVFKVRFRAVLIPWGAVLKKTAVKPLVRDASVSYNGRNQHIAQHESSFTKRKRPFCSSRDPRQEKQADVSQGQGTMMLPLCCLEAAVQADEILQDLGITTLPVDPFAIAEEHGIAVQSKLTSSPGVCGFLVKAGNIFGVMCATPLKNEGVTRFTLAHELGHYFLPGHPEALFPGGQGRHASKSGFVSRGPREEEADCFAAALLMPNGPFRAEMEGAGQGFPAIEYLASVCVTPITATAIRYATLSPNPVVVIVSSGRNVDYCLMSESISDIPGICWIRKDGLLPHGTLSSAFSTDPARVKAGAKAEGWTHLDLWLNGAPEAKVKEVVVGLAGYEKALTVLFTEDALPDEDDPDDSDEMEG
jgi:hypothetical protein